MMRLIKLKAERLFDGYHLYEDKVLLLQPDGTVEALVNRAEAGDDVKEIKGMVSPGFINCHCHMELSHLKGEIPEHTGLIEFVEQVVQKRNVPEEWILQSIADAEEEMKKNGIVAVGDICNTTDTLLQKQKKKLYYHSFIETIGFDPKLADSNLAHYEHIYEQFVEKLFPRDVSLTPHAPYSVSQPLLKKILQHKNNKKLFSIHNQELADENDWFIRKTGGFTDMFRLMKLNTEDFVPSGKSSLQTYLPKFQPDQQILFVHNVHTSEADIRFALERIRHCFWCLCPNANEYISRRLPDLPMFIKNGAAIVLGTDSLASNHALNIWEEIKTLQAHFPEISLEQMLQWATLNGARALNIDAQYGSFEKGKKPGMVVIKKNGSVSSYDC